VRDRRRLHVKIDVIRHLAFEDLGAFESLLSQRASALRILDAGIDDVAAIDPREADLTIVLGGPIGAYDDALYPFLRDETALLAARLAADRAVFGICLGAQLLARAAGAKVAPMGVKEIGFAPVELTEAGYGSCLAPLGAEPATLHWHGDMFELPQGAVHLASTAVCANQAFALGRRSIGVQFHAEAGGPGFERWLIGHAGELAAEKIDPRDLRRDAAALGPTLARTAEAILAGYLAAI
jgi:GMP synthase (glutamine-hydrolysing)